MTVVAAIAACLPVFAEPGERDAFAIGGAVLMAVWAAVAVWQARTTLARTSRLALVRDLHRQGSVRALPAGDLSEHARLHDVRDDGAARIQRVGADEQSHAGLTMYSIRLVVSPMVAGGGALVAPILWYALADELPSGASAAVVALFVLGPLGLLILGVLSVVRMMRENVGAQARVLRVNLETNAYLARSGVLSGEEPDEAAVSIGLRWLAAAGGVVLGAVVLWQAVTNPFGLVMIVAVSLLLLVGAPIVWVRMRNRATRVVPLARGGRDVLSGAGTGWVSWSWNGHAGPDDDTSGPGAITLDPRDDAAGVTLSGERLVAIRPLPLRTPYTHGGVALIGRDEVVVLTGKHLPEPTGSVPG